MVYYIKLSLSDNKVKFLPIEKALLIPTIRKQILLNRELHIRNLLNFNYLDYTKVELISILHLLQN